MTVPVGLEQLHSEVSRFGDAPYLLTVADDGRPHAVSVRVVWAEGELVLSGGTRSRSHAAARPDVTLLWRPIEDGGFSLIVDGTASVSAEQIAIRPVSAVFHRSLAAGPDGTPGSECRPVLRPEATT
ncbi:MAG TPA: pyridoxamine 5'-phosphate oxidase family protein [Acidimicrobiales bacterium]|nr:pyridoxamine 5'-phosphate oxidase family protein [Acidimicrobiales bacterium]